MHKLFGALLIVAGCGILGYLKVSAHRKETESLKHLITMLEYMSCTLQYQLLPLPDVCRQIYSNCKGRNGNVFLYLAEELDGQISPDVQSCMDAVLSKTKEIPGLTYDAFTMLGRNLGNFGLDGQLKGIESVCEYCEDKLRIHTENQQIRLRTYQTLALCAGAAIAILFI